MFKSLYLKVKLLAQKENAKKWLYGLSFAESSFFPIPPDILLIPICLENIKDSYKLAFWTTFYSVLGGLVGYMIGAFAFMSAEKLIDTLGYASYYEQIQQYFEKWGVLFIFIAGFSPIPYKIITISSGAFGFNLFLFSLISFIARGSRFYLLAILIKYFGKSINNILNKYVNPVSYAIVLILFIYIIYYVFN